MQVIVLNVMYNKNIRNSTPKKENYLHIYTALYTYIKINTHTNIYVCVGGGVYKHSSDEHKRRFLEKLSIYVSL